ncbi:hypothetical protein DdX_13818 [Ditylenchus destructor]|uniref:Uncharacterized protein n=1 Tax=Ditylenchus destructor TaxID=166010 RepID=A0AAD4MVC5_9BILA|nr:hypothetical protein DdX_13818 [Ditylenchus destructor]
MAADRKRPFQSAKVRAQRTTAELGISDQGSSRCVICFHRELPWYILRMDFVFCFLSEPVIKGYSMGVAQFSVSGCRGLAHICPELFASSMIGVISSLLSSQPAGQSCIRNRVGIGAGARSVVSFVIEIG